MDTAEQAVPKKGYVYILINQQKPDFVIVGTTDGSPEAVANEMSVELEIPGGVEVAYAELVADCGAMEEDVARVIGLGELKKDGPFLDLPLEDAKMAIGDVAGDYPVWDYGEVEDVDDGKGEDGSQRLPAYIRPLVPSDELAAIVGAVPIRRTEVVKRLWQHIKMNELQDQEDLELINADEYLKPVFAGKEQVSMFEMTKLVSKHLR